ncbi:DUF2524 family protein [Pradoshia sp. D12]|uniref:YtzC family protein n=1 Tax=Bacillaceae TaxID=186817 RepID=UPI00080AD339|nr:MULTISPECIES: YtzC family protein [Bacillaceae]OCA81894.1 hypothetical protein A8L44_14980 [Bacillus sp. FJAT-27986]QFK72570.1 DUF2524 family protein [Pradoshia sp. D12]TPF70686.1 DUF2524 family protein [Bacillus sp. D12]
MATRKSMGECMERCTNAIEFAEEQYKESAKQEHYNEAGYTEALVRLENSFNELEAMDHSANDQQRDMLNRMKIQVQDIQHAMVVRRR